MPDRVAGSYDAAARLADPTTPHRDAAFSEGGFLLSEEPLLEAGDAGQYRHKQELQHERTDLVGRVVAVRTDEWCYVERLYEGPELYDRRTDLRETTNLAGRPEMADVDLLADVVVGAVLHRSLATGEPDAAFVDALIDLLADVAYARLLLAKRQATNPLRSQPG